MEGGGRIFLWLGGDIDYEGRIFLIVYSRWMIEWKEVIVIFNINKRLIVRIWKELL